MDSKGRVINSLLEANNPVLLNDCSGVGINVSDTLSAHIRVVSSDQATKCLWHVHDDRFGNDQLLVLASLFESLIHIGFSSRPSWKTD